MDYKDIIGKLWGDYSRKNPSVNKIHSLLQAEDEQVVNDHIALRTFDLPLINKEKLSKIFLECGYVERGEYFFEEKKLKASHYEHSNDHLAPKIFISELITNEFSPLVRQVAHDIEQAVANRRIGADDIVYAQNLWMPLSFEMYESLRKESEYAAWLYVYGFRANHFTVFINALKKYNSVEKMNQFLIKNGFTLNSSGGVIKGNEKELLKQSSILADEIEVDFMEGKKIIPCCYYEFAQRYVHKNGKLFTGFIAKSADKIFESTNFRK
jgi:hypothetical protein